MLRSLQVRNYVLIDSLEIEFPAGLVIITGQTGAGKSILLGAISLLMGAKADASVIGDSGDTCVVEGEFECPGDALLKDIFEEADLDWNGGSILIRRVVSRTGRSRSFVGDEPVSKDVLQDISARLIDIHSQHENLILNDASFRLGVLDAFAGNGALREDCAAAWKALAAAKKALSEATSKLERLRGEQDFNSAALQQLQDAALKEGELEELEAEQKALANAEEIRESLMQASQLYDGDAEGQLPVASALKDAQRLVYKAGNYLPKVSELGDRLESVRTELKDIFSDLESFVSDTDPSGGRLEAVEERISLLYGLISKHHVRTIDELIAIRDSLAGEAGDLSFLEDEVLRLEKEVKELGLKLSQVSDKLHESRQKSAAEFASRITESLHSLSLEQAVFGVELQSVPQGPAGCDGVEFTFSATGSNPQDVKKVSSGGEMSRIMLSIKDMMARFTAMPTLIFDEIDSGISGSVADNVGSMICRMGEDMQVLTITHLPQVAAKGEAHLLVSKEIASDGKAVTTIRKIEGSERVMELARMLSGASVTKEAMANAESLLQSSQARKRHA